MLLKDAKGYLLKKNKQAEQKFYSLKYQEQLEYFEIPEVKDIVAMQKNTINQIPKTSSEIQTFLSSLNKAFSHGVIVDNEQMSVDQAINKIEQNVAQFYTNENFQLKDNSPEQIKQNYEQIFLEWRKILGIFSKIDQNGLPGAAMTSYIKELTLKLENGEKILAQNQISSLGKGSDFLSRLSYVGNMLKGLYLESVGNDMINNSQYGYISIPLGQVLNSKGRQLHYDLLTMSIQESQAELSEKIRFRVGKGGSEKMANSWDEFLKEIQMAVKEEKTVTLLNDNILTELQGTIQAKAATKNIRLKNTPTSWDDDLLKPIQTAAMVDKKMWAMQVLLENKEIFKKEHDDYSALANYIISKRLNKLLADTAKFYLLRNGFYDTKDMIDNVLRQNKYVHHIGKAALNHKIGAIVVENI